eukprot:scaffold8716_cov65-Cyclotella_meneghiniana.AAC.1
MCYFQIRQLSVTSDDAPLPSTAYYPYPTTYNLPTTYNTTPTLHLRCLNAGAKQIMVSKAISNFALHRFHRMHLVFGANTDVGKSIVSAGLVRAAAATETSTVNYIKPLQCGGSDESFVLQYDRQSQSKINSQTLFSWNTPASPHLASRWEDLPVSDNQVISSLAKSLEHIIDSADEKVQSPDKTSTIIESAGGAMSPSSSSPENNSTISKQWGWSTQADLYSSLKIPVVFVGDARLGGISLPPMPVPLDIWYDENHESFADLHRLLNKKWHTHFS